jgi:hypothetical protein
VGEASARAALSSGRSKPAFGFSTVWEVAAVVLVAAAALTLQNRAEGVPFTRFDPPGFDAKIYAAMADEPAVFTVSPWGYRIMTPWLAWLLPFGSWSSFRSLALSGLGLAALLLYAFLRSRGHRTPTALAGVAAFCSSSPVAWAVHNPFLTEPVTVALEVATLVALETGASALPLALLAVLGGLSKELFPLLLPALYVALRDRDGSRRALRATAVIALAAALSAISLRMAWTPELRPRLPGSPAAAALFVAHGLWSARGALLTPSLLTGLMLLAAAGALQRASRPYLARYWLLCVTTLAAALVPPLLVDSPGDVPRLCLYVLPAAIPLALWPLDRLLGRDAPTAPPAAVERKTVRWAAGVSVLALVVVPPALVDSYRRADLRGPRNGERILAVLRESLAAARRLDSGRELSLDFTADAEDAGRLWPLYRGWAEGQGAETAAERATLLLPCLRPQPLELALSVSRGAIPPGAARLRLSLGGRELGAVELSASSSQLTLLAPASALVRGDNLLEIAAPTGLRLERIDVRPLAPGRDPLDRR